MKKKHIFALSICFIIVLLIIFLLIPKEEKDPTQTTQPTQSHTHTWGEWVLVKEATCTEKGVMTRSCECGENDTLTLAKLEHSFGEWYLSIEANCEADGEESRICQNCNYTETKIISALIHSGDEFIILDGNKNFICDHCEEFYKIETLVPSNGIAIANNTVTSIGTCKEKDIVIPGLMDGINITSIGEAAFEYESIISVIFSNNITLVSENAFYKCSKLKSVYLGDALFKIDTKAFFNCSSLASINLPKSLLELGTEAFAYCSNLKTVYMENSISKLEYGVFKHCISLTDIYFKGTIDEWKSIPKDIDWDFNTGDYTIHCSNGDIKK